MGGYRKSPPRCVASFLPDWNVSRLGLASKLFVGIAERALQRQPVLHFFKQRAFFASNAFERRHPRGGTVDRSIGEKGPKRLMLMPRERVFGMDVDKDRQQSLAGVSNVREDLSQGMLLYGAN